MTLIPLQDHTSFEKAYVQGDYPYGRQLRCKRAVWLEEGTRGDTKGRMRFVHRTTNPKAKGSVEVWNKPHYSTYSDYLLLLYNDENGHVEHTGLDASYAEKDQFNAFHSNYYSLLDEYNRKKIDEIGFLVVLRKEQGKHFYFVDEKVEPMPENCIVVDDAWAYRPETGLHQFILARVQGDGDPAILPVVSAIGYSEKHGMTYNLLDQSRLKAVEVEARLVATMPDHEMSLEHFTQSVLKRFRTFGWEEQDGRSLSTLLDQMQSADKEARKAIRQQIKDICAAYHAELLAKGGEIPQIRESVEPVEPKTVETLQWSELAFESFPHCPRVFNPIDIVDLDHGLQHRFVNPIPRVFGNDTEEVYRLLKEDDRNVIVNASRPIPGDFCFESTFRHGIFYAVGRLNLYEDDWKDLDAWDIFFVDNRAILRYIDKAVQQYGYASVAEAIADKFPDSPTRALNWIKDIAHSKNLPWASRPEPEILLVRDAVNTGINTIAALVDRFYGNEQYDYTEYEIAPERLMQHIVNNYLLDACMGYEMQGDVIVPMPEETPEEAPMPEPATQETEPDELEADEFGDGDFAIDHNQESAWSAEDDEGAIDDEPEAHESDEAVYLSILLTAADSVGHLRALDVDRLMVEASDRGILPSFRQWLLDHPLDIRVSRAIREWRPEAEEAEELVRVAIVPPTPTPPAKPDPVEPPAPATEPDVYVLKKSISPENADLILHLLQEHDLEDAIAELFEVKPEKKVLKGEVVAVRSPKRDAVKVQKGDTAARAKKNAEAFAEYKQIYDLTIALGPSKAAHQLTAGGRKIGHTTVGQYKIAIGKYLADAQIRAWFDQGLVSWSQVYAGRGDVGVVVERLRAIVERNQGAKH